MRIFRIYLNFLTIYIKKKNKRVKKMKEIYINLIYLNKIRSVVINV